MIPSRLLVRSLFSALVALALLASRAEASIIDFTDSAWSGANGNASYVVIVDGITVTVTSQDVVVPAALLTFNAGGHSDCDLVTGLSCDGDGLGITDDEVTFGSDFNLNATERIFVYFSSAVSINALGFLDLFGVNTSTGDTAVETAMWIAAHSGGAFTEGSVQGTEIAPDTLGYENVALNYTNVTALQFFSAPLFVTPNGNSDFALASIEFTVPETNQTGLIPTPEPATLSLVGIGLAGAAVRRFRKRS